MSKQGVIIIAWSSKDPKIILDCIPHIPFPTTDVLEAYERLLGIHHADWVHGNKDGKQFLREEGFKV